MDRQFTEEQTHIGNKHMKKICSYSLVVREMQIKRTISYNFTFMSQTEIKKRVKTYCWWDNGKVLSLIVGRNVKCFWKAIWIYLLKLKIYISLNPETPLLQFCLAEIRASVSKDRCSWMFITAFFKEKENTENSQCPSVGEYVLNYSTFTP